VSTVFFVHEAHGAADTMGVPPDEKSEIAALGVAIARTAAAAATATEAPEAAETERTSLRRSTFVRSSGDLSEETSMESWNALARAAISRVHDLQGAQPSK
jgi:hypothetical protein